MATVASPADPVPETRLRGSAVLTWLRLRPSAAEVADSVWQNSHLYDGLASGSIYFLSRDPMVASTHSPYGYVGGNPLNATDPSGLCGWAPWDAIGCVVGAGQAAVGWVNNNVVQPVSSFVNNNEFGWCDSGSAGFIVGGVASGCVVFNAHSFGFTGTLGGGLEVPGGASVTAGPLFAAGARNVSDLGNTFDYAGASGGELAPVFGADFAHGTGTCGQSVTTFAPSVGAGVNLPWPISGHAGVSNTWYWSP